MPAGLTVADIAVGLVPILAALVTVGIFRWRRKDEIFTEVTPGLTPAFGASDHTERVRRGVEYSGPVAVRFNAPDNSTPALSGTVIDGIVHGRDLTATLVDLALRGIVTLEKETSPKGKDDWRISRTGVGEETMAEHERVLLDALLAGRTSVLLGSLRQADVAQRWRKAEIAVYRAVVDRGWYRKHPRSRNGLLSFLGVALIVAACGAGLVAAVAENHWQWVPLGIGLGVGGVLLIWRGRGRTPRTALGTAARIQALGYEEYLKTAEAGQLQHEELAGEIRSMLPYAVAFGVAPHVASVLGEALRSARIAEGSEAALGMAADMALDPGIFYLMDGLVDLVGSVDLSALADVDPGDALSGLLDGFDGLGDALSNLGDGIGDLVPGDGCLDGCDGCDVGCIDF